MRRSILLLALSAAVLGGCTSAYKTGQTPDDVYFSPARQHDEYVQVKENDDRQYQGDDYYDDRYLRMKVHNRVMWNDLNDWYYYDRYSYAYNYNYGSWNNPYNSWNYYYNPYCHQYRNPYYSNIVIINPKQPATQPVRPRNFSLSSYTNTNYNNSNGRYVIKSPQSSAGRPLYNNSNNNNSNSRGFGNFVRQALSGGNNSGYNNSNNNSSNSNSSSRTYTPSSSSSSSGSGNSGSSGGGVSRPVRN